MATLDLASTQPASIKALVFHSSGSGPGHPSWEEVPRPTLQQPADATGALKVVLTNS
jgi:hypothetical protein